MLYLGTWDLICISRDYRVWSFPSRCLKLFPIQFDPWLQKLSSEVTE